MLVEHSDKVKILLYIYFVIWFSIDFFFSYSKTAINLSFSCVAKERLQDKLLLR